MFTLSMAGCGVLTFLNVAIKPPQHLPDLFPLLTSVYSCIHFLCFLLYFNYKQFSLSGISSKQTIDDKKHK